MAEWNNVVRWAPEPLEAVARSCTERQGKADAASSKLLQVKSGIQSQGETASAIETFLQSQLEKTNQLRDRLGDMADASWGAASGIRTVQAEVQECRQRAGSAKMIITEKGVVKLHPSYLAECQKDPQLFAHAQYERQNVADAVRNTLALADHVDASYQDKLFQLSDEGQANDPVVPDAPAEDPPENVPYLDDALGYSYDSLMSWMGSPEAAYIQLGATLDPWLFNDLLAVAVAYRGKDMSWEEYVAMPAVAAAIVAPGGLTVALSAYTLYDQIKVNAPWDMKPYLADRYSQPLRNGYFYLTDDEGNSVRSDTLGNVNYGFMLAYFGVDEQIALDAANVGTDDTGAGDDPVDDASIRLGYEMYRKYSTDMTREQYAEELKNADLG